MTAKVTGSSGPTSAVDLPPDQSVGYLVREAHRAFLRALAAHVSPHGVTIGMWYFLRALWERDGVTQRELSRRVKMMEPTTATALESMERRGLITRSRNPRDRRKVNIHLTERGRSLRNVLLPYAIEVNRIALEGIPSEETTFLRQQLRHIIRNLDHHAARDADATRREHPQSDGRIALRETRNKE